MSVLGGELEVTLLAFTPTATIVDMSEVNVILLVKFLP